MMAKHKNEFMFLKQRLNFAEKTVDDEVRIS